MGSLESSPCAEARANPAIVKAVLRGAPRAFENDREPGRLIVIGPDRRGRFWTISFEETSGGSKRVITGWPSKPRDIRIYRGD
jgi:hypothetical protein